MDSKEYILTQDIGIYSCKAALFSLEGETICTNRVDYAPDVVPDDRSTQPPSTWWTTNGTRIRLTEFNLSSVQISFTPLPVFV